LIGGEAVLRRRRRDALARLEVWAAAVVAVRKDHSPAGIGKNKPCRHGNPLEVRGKLKLAIEFGIEFEPAGDSGAEARGCDPQPFRPHPNLTPILIAASRQN
jgi:hypothetical protein